MPSAPPRYMSEISWRHPTFKFHANLGHAKNAVSLKGFGKIWEWNFETNSWDLLYDVPRDNDTPHWRRVMPWNVK